MDRYRVDTSEGEPGIRTNDKRFAEKVASKWGVQVVDTEGGDDGQ
jgi:hypothetical protein